MAVIGIDASTSALKAIAFDSAGRLLADAHVSYPLHTPAPGQFEQNADDWWDALCGATRALMRQKPALRIDALCIGHQRETFVLLGKDGATVRPAITWLDERARADVARLSAALGRERIRDISGKPPDPTPALYALAWLARNEPENLARTSTVLDVQGYLNWRLTGELVTSTASADPLGLLDMAAGTWSPDLVAAAGLAMTQLPSLGTAGLVIGRLTPQAGTQTGLRAGLPIVAGAGDGQLSGLGVGALQPGAAYLSLGTGIVSGMHADAYATSDGYRTLYSPTGTGFMMETVLRSGMTLAEWAARNLGDGSDTRQRLAALTAEAEDVAPGAQGLLVMPYFAGVMNPYWDESARGALLGLALSHGPAHIFRAVLEGLAFEQAVATRALETSIDAHAARFIACGGGTKSRLMLTILAAVLQRPIAVSPVAEGVALGAAMLAAAAIGMHDGVLKAAQAMAGMPASVIAPDPDLVAAYAPRLAIYADLFEATRPIHQRLQNLEKEAP